MVSSTIEAPMRDVLQLQAELPKHVLAGSLRYSEFRQIGYGGKAEVFRCRDVTLSRNVAFKVLHHSLMESSIEQRMLVREARIMATLTDSAVPAIHDLGRDRHGRPYFTMALIEGRTLRDMLDLVSNPEQSSSELPTSEELVAFVLQVGESLNYVHRQGIVHGDLKPENLIIGRDGRVRIIDWGLARITSDTEISDDRLETQWGRQGSPLYMSPEQVACEPILHPSSDIYSLSTILYECLTLQSPLRGKDTRETLELVASAVPDQPSSVAPHRDIPAALDVVCMRGLEKSPLDRFDSMGEFCERLRDAHLEQLLSFERSW